MWLKDYLSMCDRGPLIDLEYADDIVLFAEYADKIQSFGSPVQ